MYERISSLPVAKYDGPHYVVERDSEGDTMFTFRFTVVGRGEFPFDMLRRDDCFPADPESAASLGNPFPHPSDPVREITLVTRHPNRLWLPTFERWRSFGWIVKSDA